jgi:hypothetical protein
VFLAPGAVCYLLGFAKPLPECGASGYLMTTVCAVRSGTINMDQSIFDDARALRVP